MILRPVNPVSPFGRDFKESGRVDQDIESGHSKRFRHQRQDDLLDHRGVQHVVVDVRVVLSRQDNGLDAHDFMAAANLGDLRRLKSLERRLGRLLVWPHGHIRRRVDPFMQARA